MQSKQLIIVSVNRPLHNTAIVAILVSSCLLRPSRVAASGDAVFPKGTITLDTTAAYLIGLDEEDVDVTSLSVGVGYFLIDDLSLGAEISVNRALQHGADPWMTGISAVLRHHLVRFDRYTLFATASFGPVWATDNVPPAGTDFNFITRVGLGVTAELRPDLHLLAGLRWFHLSNARMEGVERNPTVDGMEMNVGLLWVIR
jgi:hypothetical protein